MKIRGFLAVLLLALVIAYFIFFAKTGDQSGVETKVRQFDRTKIRVTEADMETLAREILTYTMDASGLPEDLSDLRRFRPQTAGYLDGWGRTLRYVKLSESTFQLRSAGPDGVFETEDDILKEY